MKTRIFILAFLATGLGACSGQTNMPLNCNQIINKTFDMADFNAIEVSHAFEVEMIPSDRESVELTIPADAEQYIEIRQEGSGLFIGMKTGYFFRFLNNDNESCLKAYVYFKDLKKVTASEASEINVKGVYDAQNQDLSINLSGASSFEGNIVNVAHLKAVVSEASELDMKGNGNALDMNLSEASQAEMENFSVKSFLGVVSSASKAELYVTESFSGKAEGASAIEVKGNPRVLKAEKSLSSSIKFE